MLKEKQKSDMAIWMAYILIALMFGAFLGSPVPDLWAGRISEAIAAVSEKTTETANLHSSTTDKISAGNNTAAGIFAVGKTTEVLIPEAKTSDSVTEENEANGIKEKDRTTDAITGGSEAAENSIAMVVSDPPASETAEAQPDYIILNANRGGVADRQEMDVLVHLINAEAYGLSYKAKVAVGQVVMNRWKGPYYGDDLLAIMTAPYQFTPIYNGSAYKKKIEPSSLEAANAVLAGAGVKELTEDTYYFVDPDFTEDKTIETKMEFVCEIEGIHFFRPPDKDTH
ncbi:MAG TPA: cell wall hydrolase [Anaerovoracaceae bacterium]|nr:cell wall hydrolase [Anaerovoracaceae bacterium]